jgi:acetoin utilization protein AcuB
MRLSEIMSSPAITIRSTASAAEAAVQMERARIRHLVVLNGRQITGVLCDHDLRGVEPGRRVAELISAPAVTLPANADVQEAARLLRGPDVGGIAILAGKRLAGIVTTSDLLALLGRGAVRVAETTPKWTLPRRGPTHRPERRRSS